MHETCEKMIHQHNLRCLTSIFSTGSSYTRAGLATMGWKTLTEKLDGENYHGRCRKGALMSTEKELQQYTTKNASSKPSGIQLCFKMTGDTDEIQRLSDFPIMQSLQRCPSRTSNKTWTWGADCRGLGHTVALIQHRCSRWGGQTW